MSNSVAGKGHEAEGHNVVGVVSGLEGATAESLLRELIRIPSVSALSNRAMVDRVREVLASRLWRFREFNYRGADGAEKVNLIAVPPSQDADRMAVDLAFVCHTDTVPYNAEWGAAIQPVESDGFLHGCGACDVKGFLAALLAAILRVPAEQFASSMALVLTADEEIGCIGARHLVDAGVLRAKHAIVGEPTGMHPARAGKGYCLAEIRAIGKTAHSAHPGQGVSAIYAAARLIAAIEGYAESLQSLQRDAYSFFDPPYTTMNVGTIQGGTAKNIVPGECSFLLEWRPVPGQAANEVPDAVRAMVETLGRDDSGIHYEWKILREQEGFETRESSPLVRRLEGLTGRSPIAVPFSTEAPWMARLGEDVVVFGPGDMRVAHSERECLELRELDACVGIFARLLREGVETAR